MRNAAHQFLASSHTRVVSMRVWPGEPAGLVIDGWLAVEWLMGQTSLSNRPLFLGGILLILVGGQLISLGLLGEMISKTQRSEDEYSIRDYIR